jgi:hypothetical protein
MNPARAREPLKATSIEVSSKLDVSPPIKGLETAPPLGGEAFGPVRPSPSFGDKFHETQPDDARSDRAGTPSTGSPATIIVACEPA